jgi:hypothetical protein
MLVQVGLCEFGCDNAFLAVQAHNSADEAVLSILARAPDHKKIRAPNTRAVAKKRFPLLCAHFFASNECPRV